MAQIEWSRQSGKSARDGICRSLARKGLDLFDMAGVPVVAGYPHSSRHLVDGLVRNQVEETLGASKYEEICNQPAVLRHIHYCQSGLSFADGQNSHKLLPPALAQPPSLLNHDYLVLELPLGPLGTETLFLRAEKTGHPPEHAGLLVTAEPCFELVKTRVCLFSIRCFDRDIGRVPEVVALLLDFCPEYSLRDQNCWQYTRRMARRLVSECRQRGGGGGGGGLGFVGREEEEEDWESRLLEIEEASVERRIVAAHWKKVMEKGKVGMKSLWKAWGNDAGAGSREGGRDGGRGEHPGP